MKSTIVRKKFFDFFINRGHQKVASSSIIPAQDPTILFANAGMNQFKDLFLGLEKRNYTRAVTIQKCVRAGGKHNDLENVGFTKRHLTFFEMMGNFSFGDYFKKDAIQYSWDFLTKEMGLPVEKLYATVYKTDDESYDLWHTMIGIPAERIQRLGEKENFWQMGDTGPCGPCTELHIDRGPAFGCADIATCGPACDCDRFLEIWNMVFMQFDRQPDGSFKPLKQTGVDTGMGLERLCTVVQNVDSVYQTDLFTPIIKRIEELSGIVYAEQPDALKAAFHVMADHIRSSTMIIADGCAPSNEGRGYVLRKIIRRAALFCQKLTEKNIFPELSATVIQELGDIYPELKSQTQLVYTVLDSEVKKFSANLIRGKQIFEKYCQESSTTKTITGAQAFKLYDTYGFPTELITLLAQEQGFTVDMAGFEQEMRKQQDQSGQKKKEELHVDLPESITTGFTGYTELETNTEITALVHNGAVVSSVSAGSQCYVITKKSPFFIVGGGQVEDEGWLKIDSHLVDTEEIRFIGTAIAVKITTPIALKVNKKITAIVNKELRANTIKNHTATHLLQAALVKLLGPQVKQAGSFVHPDYLRFDFTYSENVDSNEIATIEKMVNAVIQENIPVSIENTTYADAVKKGATAFFGDKYNPENVRMVSVPGVSIELCGGTHVRATGDIGCFKITEISALSAAHRRVVAVTGPRAVELFQESFDTVKALSQEFKVKQDEVATAVAKQQLHIKELLADIKKLKKELNTAQVPQMVQQIETIGSLPFLCALLTDTTNEELRDIAAQLNAKKPGLYFLANIQENNTFSFLCALAPQLSEKISLKDLATWLQKEQGIRGGGSATMLQGGGTQLSPEFITALKQWIAQNHK